MDDVRSDAEILARASTEPELFGILFDRHFATIHRYLERRVGADGADELSAEVFRIAFEKRARFQALHESALPWFYGLATNLMLKRWRGERRHLRALARASNEWRDVLGDLGGVDERLSAQADGSGSSTHSRHSPSATATSSSSSRGRSSRTRRSPPRSTSPSAPCGLASIARDGRSANS